MRERIEGRLTEAEGEGETSVFGRELEEIEVPLGWRGNLNEVERFRGERGERGTASEKEKKRKQNDT